MSAPDVDELTEALLHTTEWTSTIHWDDPEHWFYDGSLREFAEELIANWDMAQDIRRRREAGEFEPK